MSTSNHHSHGGLYPEGPDVDTPVIGAQPNRRGRSNSALLDRAAGGDSTAWSDLIERLQPKVWAATGAAGLPPDVAASVGDLVWLRLAQRLDNRPPALTAWLIEVVEAEASRWHRSQNTTSADAVRLLEDLRCQLTATST
jgi:DNA-directed RNA polymerase specialized sigma24 family protein